MRTMRLDCPNLFEKPLREVLEALGYHLHAHGNRLDARKERIHITFYWIPRSENSRTLIFGHIDPLGLHLKEASIVTGAKLWEAIHEVLREYRRLAGSYEVGASSKGRL